ncbi:MAG: aldehyde dehydrogenase, partial [Rhodospirillaceae bacterium]|nr:aldehyde dehydrogenase [Rhodospirillaceae bacterium]
GSLAAIGSAGVANLAIVVLDNERYGETGMQPSHTAQHLDLAGVAESCGFAETRLVNDQAGLDVALPIIHQAPGPVAIIVKIKAEDLPRVLPPRDGAFLKDRFRAALLGEEQAQA